MNLSASRLLHALAFCAAVITCLTHSAAAIENNTGRLTQLLDPDGITTATFSDARRIVGPVTTFAYDMNNRVLSSIDNGLTTSYTYDFSGRVLTETDPGGRTQYQYDSNGHLSMVTDPAGRTTSYTYDTNGNMTSFTDNNLHQTTNYQYDSAGRIIERAQPNGVRTTYIYDSMGREIEQYDTTPPSSTRSNDISYTYDAVTGDLTSIKNNDNGQTTTFVGAVAWFLITGDTSSWPSAPCKVIGSRVIRADGPYGPQGSLMVVYKGEYQLRYTVGDRGYLTWASAGWLDKNRDFVQSKVDALPDTCPAVVRYNPKHPERATASSTHVR